MKSDLEFEHIDADAVCEKCGTVNPEETLLCKTCGNNLREQRQRRISSNYVTPPPVSARTVGVRALTGLLSVLGILVVLFVVMNLGNIESTLVNAMSTGERTVNVWTGETGKILDEMALELTQYPSSNSDLVEALNSQLVEDSFNGRYVVVNPTEISRAGILGEALLRKSGDEVFFVVKARLADVQVRGVAELHTVDGVIRPVVFNSASAEVSGERFPSKGFSSTLENGGHLIAGSCDNGFNVDVLAFRIR